MKTMVLYKSKTGFTEIYAKWIAEALNADLYEAKNFNPATFDKYDNIIHGGSLYASGILGVKNIKNNIVRLKNKKVVVFACGASTPDAGVLEEVKAHNFTADQLKQIKVFYLQGGFNFSKLSAFDKVLMTLLKWGIMIKKRKGDKMTQDEIDLLGAYKKPVDFTHRDNIKAITEYINR